MDKTSQKTVPKKRRVMGGSSASAGRGGGSSDAPQNEEEKKARKRARDRRYSRMRRETENYNARKINTKKDLTPRDFEEVPVAGPSNGTWRIVPDPHPAAAQTMDEREPSNVELNLWSDVAYTIPYDPVPRSVDGPVIDPSLCMNEPIMDPAPGGHSEPYAFIERPTNEPSVRGMPLHLESPPTPPAPSLSNASARSDLFQYINLPPTSSPAPPHPGSPCRAEATLQVTATMVDAGVQTAAAMAAVGTQTTAVSTADAGVEALPAVPPPAAPPQGSDPKDLTQAGGFPFPEYAEVVEWADGHRTYLPWASDPKRPTKNLLKKDAIHVKRLSEIARPSTESDYIVHLEYAAFKSEVKLVERIHEELAHGNPVILKGYPSKPVEMNLDSLYEGLGLTPHRVFEAIDAVNRATDPSDYPHVRMTLKDFCKALGNGRVLTILDCATIDGETPSFVKHLDQGHTAWPKMFHRFHDRHYVPIDVQQSKSWILMHTALVHTYVHHDAEGSGAWTRILSGKKLWFFVQPPHFGECESRTEYSEMIKPYLDCVTKRGYDARSYHSDSRCFFVRASAGDIIIQPPGAPHEVYTPEPSVTQGGHFMTRNTMHLTEVARSFDKKTKGIFTNQGHVSAQSTIAMMMAALQFESKPVLHRIPFAAWCNMILHPGTYKRFYHPISLPAEPTSREAERSKKKSVASMSTVIKPKPQPEIPKDLAQAARMARKAVELFQLPTNLFHPPSVVKNQTDFIFDLRPDGGTWMDPGPVLEVGDFFEQFREKL